MTGRETMDQMASTYREESIAEQATTVLHEKTGQAAQSTKERVRSELDTRTSQVGEQARSLAQALRQTQGSSGDAPPSVTRVTSALAERLEQAGGYLDRVRGEDLIADAERIVRQRPWLLAGGSALVGFLGSRLLKASSERRYESGATRAASFGPARRFDPPQTDPQATSMPALVGP